MNTLELSTHTEGSQIHLFANDGTDCGNGFGITSATREACFYAQKNGFTAIRINGGESFDATAKLIEIDDAAFAPKKKKARR